MPRKCPQYNTYANAELAAWEAKAREYEAAMARRNAAAQEPDAELLGLDAEDEDALDDEQQEEHAAVGAAPAAAGAGRGRRRAADGRKTKGTDVKDIDQGVLRSCFEKCNLKRKKEGQNIDDTAAVASVAEELGFPSKIVDSVLMRAGLRQKGGGGRRSGGGGGRQQRKRKHGGQRKRSRRGDETPAAQDSDSASSSQQADSAGTHSHSEDSEVEDDHSSGDNDGGSDNESDTEGLRATGALHERDDEPCVVCGVVVPFETGDMLFCDVLFCDGWQAGTALPGGRRYDGACEGAWGGAAGHGLVAQLSSFASSGGGDLHALGSAAGLQLHGLGDAPGAGPGLTAAAVLSSGAAAETRADSWDSMNGLHYGS
ncbi:hypothetical protein HXX76_016304 [Chlamydomonas incerta]|uniref:Uncharacterized protein n=1 Tax=Chlamydomonas incerta TaxID=51695 RepID=A0A835S839_CHLIN|nr:hypothetical protein HXX76_016304 [Chlamydomonas incerta]|eukprot:KAG2422064.1 hypothetical protein HXX76_016304 [Chlamydomonas incerta]